MSGAQTCKTCQHWKTPTTEAQRENPGVRPARFPPEEHGTCESRVLMDPETPAFFGCRYWEPRELEDLDRAWEAIDALRRDVAELRRDVISLSKILDELQKK